MPDPLSLWRIAGRAFGPCCLGFSGNCRRGIRVWTRRCLSACLCQFELASRGTVAVACTKGTASERRCELWRTIVRPIPSITSLEIWAGATTSPRLLMWGAQLASVTATASAECDPCEVVEWQSSRVFPGMTKAATSVARLAVVAYHLLSGSAGAVSKSPN
jgi:hypothetical protein